MKRVLFILAFAMLFVGCRTPKTIYVPIRSTDTVSEVHQDRQRERDSIIIERNTIIKEADSALLMEYGIKLKDNERAIVILQNDFMNRIRELESKKADTVIKTEIVQVPYPVEVPTDKPMTKWQKFQIKGFWWLSVGLVGYVLWTTRKRWLKWIKRG